MSKHTPGPWRDTGAGREKHMIYSDSAGYPRPVADAGWSTDMAEQQANARLIAAAPELLAALIDVMGWIPGGNFWHTDAPREAMEKARAAIAKATGEGA